MRKILCLSILFLVGCATIPKTTETIPGAESQEGIQWETKAQIRDYKNNKTNNLSIDLVAIKKSYLRMEVTATLGYPVASLVSGPQTVKMAIYPQKKFYFGNNSEAALNPILGFPLNGQAVQDIIFDEPLRGWKCEAGDEGLVKACKRTTQRGDVVVAWQERKEKTKRVVIQGPRFEMEWLFKDSTVVKPVKANTFKLEPPKGYKVIAL